MRGSLSLFTEYTTPEKTKNFQGHLEITHKLYYNHVILGIKCISIYFLLICNQGPVP